MLLTLQNESVKLCIDTMGAQMMELSSKDGVQFLWGGDSRYWGDRAPILFPFIGRLTDNLCRINGLEYPMTIHGFAAASEFEIETKNDRRAVLRLSDNERTRRSYPFSFDFRVTYVLSGHSVRIIYSVYNCGKDIMCFALGGHPGFRVPLVDGSIFEDYYLKFSMPCEPDRLGFTPSLFLSGVNTPHTLEDSRILRLRHELFDNDAIVLQNMAREISLCSEKTPCSVTVSYPQMPYLGIWHTPGTRAPYVCIEPWTSLPSRQGIVEELSCKSDLIRLEPQKTYKNEWSISIQSADIG